MHFDIMFSLRYLLSLKQLTPLFYFKLTDIRMCKKIISTWNAEVEAPNRKSLSIQSLLGICHGLSLVNTGTMGYAGFDGVPDMMVRLQNLPLLFCDEAADRSHRFSLLRPARLLRLRWVVGFRVAAASRAISC